MLTPNPPNPIPSRIWHKTTRFPVNTGMCKNPYFFVLAETQKLFNFTLLTFTASAIN